MDRLINAGQCFKGPELRIHPTHLLAIVADSEAKSLRHLAAMLHLPLYFTVVSIAEHMTVYCDLKPPSFTSYVVKLVTTELDEVVTRISRILLITPL